MSKLTKYQIIYTAKLAKLELTETEVLKFYTQIEGFLKHAEKMNEVDTSKVKETAQVTGLENSLREDNVSAGLTQEEALSNAPKSKDGYFEVKKYHNNQ